MSTITADERAAGDAGSAPSPRLSLRRRKVDDDIAEKGGWAWTTIAWFLTVLFFAPVGWMVLTSFHSEADAATNPPTPSTPALPWSCSARARPASPRA